MITKNIDSTWYMVIHTGQEFVHHKEKKINQHPLHLCGIPSGPFVTQRPIYRYRVKRRDCESLLIFIK